MNEKDVWRAANQMIEYHGDDAATHAAMRADAMLEAGDLDGQAVWKADRAGDRGIAGGGAGDRALGPLR